MATSSDLALLDTNVLIYSADTRSAHHETCAKLIDDAAAGFVEACLAPQVLLEFYAVVTRSGAVARPRTSGEAAAEVEKYAQTFRIISPPNDLAGRVISLVRQTAVAGPAVFDVALASTMLANDVSRIYTYDQGFSRIPGITVLTP